MIATLELGDIGSRQLFRQLAEDGAVFVRDPRVPVSRFRQALEDAAAFFDLPDEERSELSIDRSPHHRGYSVMHNDRDWREQVHFGRDVPSATGVEPFWRLQGPNLWPESNRWRERMNEWFDLTQRAGDRVLRAVAETLDLDAGAWLGTSPYRIVKLIAYHPQPDAGTARPGVAPHVDFSLITLTVQDEVGGLQVRRRDGSWVHVEPVEGAWLVHVGELLQFVTGNRVAATPHRVVNPSVRRTRVSMPYFVCPSLDVSLHAGLEVEPIGEVDVYDPGHVHAVLDPSRPARSIAFGPAEWHRKGENIWCAVCCPE